jgi:hypothetical protein
MLLATSKMAVLVNGCPGPWFPCRRGLRQGDPLSPYLFLLVADVLQRMIQAEHAILHPLTSGAPCLVLQYTDDTLIVTKADAGSVARLKLVLDTFTEATGLKINYGKSSVVPLHASPARSHTASPHFNAKRNPSPKATSGCPSLRTR